MNHAKVTHFTQQGYKITGIIHAGMNDGEEVPSYKSLGIQNIIGFEPLKSAANFAQKLYPDIKVVQLALGNEDKTMDLIVTAGDGKGSSLLKIVDKHPEFSKWRDVDIVIGKETVQVCKFTSWVASDPEVNLSLYDCLVLDTQGNELDILMGMGKYLEKLKYLSVELSDTPVYVGEHPAQEVVDWLVKQGFTQDSEIQSHNDVFFVRSDIKKASDRIYHGLA